MSGSRRSMGALLVVWLVIARELTGLYWLYFGVQKWSNYGWVQDIEPNTQSAGTSW